MVAPTLIAAAYNMPGHARALEGAAAESAALLVEFRAEDPDALDAPERAALTILAGAHADRPAALLARPARRSRCCGACARGCRACSRRSARPASQLIIEDVCVPPGARRRGAPATSRRCSASTASCPGLAGHASAGNLHFLLTPNFGEPADLERYDAFMHELVELIVDKYDGSLKAEHGTGLNMAPFVEREWGPKATEMMWRIKQLADPDGILAPGVVLNRDPGVHLRNLKSTPEIEEVGDQVHRVRLLRAGLPVAQRHDDAAPAHRAAARDGPPARRIARARGAARAVRARRRSQTCAADGSCMHACPVGDRHRQADQGVPRPRARRSAPSGWARAWPAATARRALARGAAARRWAGAPRVARQRPAGRAPAELPFTVREGAAAVYMPACINRIFGNDRGRAAHPTVPGGARGDLPPGRAAAVDPAMTSAVTAAGRRGARRAYTQGS